MIPEIQTIAKDTSEFLLLVELAKSANTRNLIGTILVKDCKIVDRVRELIDRPSTDAPLRKRLEQTLVRWEKEVRKRKFKAQHHPKLQ
jgi:hypothetical protein